MKIKTNPTAKDERDEVARIMASANPGDTIWVHHSGPGCQLPTPTKKERRQAALEKHYAVCEALGRHMGMKKPDGKKISTRLFDLERQMHRCSTAYCNGEKTSVKFLGKRRVELDFGRDGSEAWEKAVELGTEVIKAIFEGRVPNGLHFNGDARGYAVKLEPNSIITDPPLHQDWGGYQILSPEIES